MPSKFYGGLDFGTSGVRISIINSKKELTYTNSVSYGYELKKPNSWINSCELLLDGIPIDLKRNIDKLAISGTSGTLTACDIKGNTLGEAIPYNYQCIENKRVIKSITSGAEHLQTPYSSLAKALKLIAKYGTNILLRHQADWITGWFLNNWSHGEEGNNIKLGWDLIKESWQKVTKILLGENACPK